MFKKKYPYKIIFRRTLIAEFFIFLLCQKMWFIIYRQLDIKIFLHRD